jgi:hypothetical protein
MARRSAGSVMRRRGMARFLRAKPDRSGRCGHPGVGRVCSLNWLPIEALHDTLAPDGRSWTPELVAGLRARGQDTDSVLNAYPRFVKRFLVFAAKAGLTRATRQVYLPEWEDVLAKAATLLPANKAALAALAEAGVTVILGCYEVDAANLEPANTKLQNVRTALRSMARRASEAGLTPRAFASEVLEGARHGELGDFATRGIYSSYCRNLWNATVLHYPELDLPLWASGDKRIGLPPEEWPLALREGIQAAVFNRPDMRPLSSETVKQYKNTLSVFLGILEHLGFALAPLVAELSPKDAVRLVFQGWPRALLPGDADTAGALYCYRRLLSEPDYQAEVLAAMRAQDGLSEGAALVENPFVGAVIVARYNEGKYTSAEGMIDRVHTINKEYFDLQTGNLKWLKNRFEQVGLLRKANPTGYDEKKSVIFKHPQLFETLMARAECLYRELDERFATRNSHWATFVRDLTYLSLVLLYPLRVKNHQMMQLGRHYCPREHVMRFKKGEVKNNRVIEFELPARGKLGWVRDLVELYIEVARPILLCGHDSDYFFVGNHTIPCAKGWLVRHAFNEILINLSRKHLAEELPPELGFLNPHMFRHIAASYQLVVKRDREMAALLLCDSIRTVEEHYADLLAYSRQGCREFFEEFEPN